MPMVVPKWQEITKLERIVPMGSRYTVQLTTNMSVHYRYITMLSAIATSLGACLIECMDGPMGCIKSTSHIPFAFTQRIHNRIINSRHENTQDIVTPYFSIDFEVKLLSLSLSAETTCVNKCTRKSIKK